jgi:transcriptional regulator with XRE-family HTH domain
MARHLYPLGRAAVPDAAQLVGEQIAYHRKRLGLSQVELAGVIGRSDSWVSQVERGVRAVDRLSVLQKVADALGVAVSDLQGGEQAEPDSDSRPEAFESLRLTLTGHPATSAVLGGASSGVDDGELARLRDAHSQVWPLVHASRYNELAPIVADLIPELERASRNAVASEQRQQARELLTDTYQAVAAMLAKLGEGDAAWVAADRAAFTAESLGSPLAVAASLFRMAHVFLALGQLSQVQAVGTAAASGLEHQPETAEVLSLRGAFRLVLAVAAARDNDRPEAYAYLDQARDIAAAIGEDRNDFGTEFGPTNAALHAVAVAVELGDAGHALDLAREINPEHLSPERQARYSIDLARAHEMRRQIGEALHYLELAERLTPEQTRAHGLAKSVARNLLQLSAPRVRPELRELAERFGVAP